jgi:hypothetical protein
MEAPWSFEVCTQLCTEFLIFHSSIRINRNRTGEGSREDRLPSSRGGRRRVRLLVFTDGPMFTIMYRNLIAINGREVTMYWAQKFTRLGSAADCK